MNAWIFQSVPEQFDLRDGLIEGETDTWRVPRYQHRIAPGDIVFFWMGGAPEIRGVYGWGQVESKPYFDAKSEEFNVDVIYKKKIPTPVLAADIKQNPKLRDLLILRAPQGTNFLVSYDEAEALVDLLPSAARPRI